MMDKELLAETTWPKSLSEHEREFNEQTGEHQVLEQIRTWIDDFNSGVDPNMSADEVINLIQGEVDKTLDD